ncbi:MAG: hypothetical protein UY41_C0030G0012, partial [Candidatus Moranbacteria bacterium GW2011_GWE1_49_15]
MIEDWILVFVCILYLVSCIL